MVFGKEEIQKVQTEWTRRPNFDIYSNEISANFLLLNFNNCKLSANKVEKELEKKGIILREMKTYGIDNHLRLTIGNIVENRLFLKEIKSIFKNV